jgi:hypothetical protein
VTERFIVIEHKDGRRVAVTPTDFHRAKVGPDGETYEELKFDVVGWEDGEPYKPARAAEDAPAKASRKSEE